MALSNRERLISLTLLVAGAVFAFDRVALNPYLELRRELAEREQARGAELVEARRVLQAERRLRQVLATIGRSVQPDPSVAEGEFLNLLHDWEQQAGVGKASFHRVRAVERFGFVHMTFHVSATGSMPAVAALLYRVETAEMPLRVDDVQMTPKGDRGADVEIQLSVSTLCRKSGPPALDRRQAKGVAGIEFAGERR